MDTRVDLVCLASDSAACDERLTEILESDQSGSLSVPLSATGNLPATHFGASGVFPEDVVDLILEEDLWESFVDDGSGAPAEVFSTFVESIGLHWIQPVD